MPRSKRRPRGLNPHKDEFSAHEALDRAHLAAAFFSDYVADHAFVQAHPKLKPVAEKLAEKLGNFYQLVGRIRCEFPEQFPPDHEVLAADLRFDQEHFIIRLNDKRELSIPLAYYPTLRRAPRVDETTGD